MSNYSKYQTRLSYNTALKNIIRMAEVDFGITISMEQAKEIRQSCRNGCALWTRDHYISTATNDDIRYMSEKGVRFGGFQIWYTADEWNEE